VIRFIVYRFFQLIPVLLLVSIVTFAFMHALPGDVIDALAGDAETNDPARRAALEKQLGLDRPIYVQYFTWLGKIVLYGDFGKSITTRRSIGWSSSRHSATVYLAVAAVIISLSRCRWAPSRHQAPHYGGLYGDHRSGGRGLHSTSGSPFSACCSSPSTWAGCPRRSINPFDDPWLGLKHLLLPAAALGRLAAITTRLTRSTMLTKSARSTSTPPVPSGCRSGG
jgi:ABC-type dipeptide/oligopeptide/nickel transport system permease component